LDRLSLGLGWQRPFSLARTLWLAPLVGGGWSMVLRRGAETTGDLRSPWLEAGLRANLALAAPYFASLAATYTARFIEVDGRWQSSLGPAVAAGLGVVF
jgi:hypothetical protein